MLLPQSPGPLFKVEISYRFPLWLILCLTGLQNAGAMDIVIANNADSGNGTLRQAIQFNESLGGGNTIVFSNIVSGTIHLTNALGELLISKNVTIIGPGPQRQSLICRMLKSNGVFCQRNGYARTQHCRRFPPVSYW